MKSTAKEVGRLSIEKLKSGALLVEKFTKRLCVRTYCIIIKICKLIQLMGVKTIQHLKGFAQYCNIQFIILKFRIRNIKSYKRKLLEQANEIKEEKVNSALVVVNYRLVLYKINILRIAKKYLRKLEILIIKVLTMIFKYSKKELHAFYGLLNEIKLSLKKKCYIIIGRNKNVFE